MSVLSTAAICKDPHLEMDTIFILPLKPHQTQILTQTLDTPTIHHLITALVARSHEHSWFLAGNYCYFQPDEVEVYN